MTAAKTIWDLVLHILDTMPWQWATFLVGWLGSIGFVHPLKVGLRRYTHVDADDRHLIAWLSAVVSASLLAWVYATQTVPPPLPAAAMLVAILTGIWSPLAFAGLQGFLRASPQLGKRKGFGWLPDLTGVANWLSGDHGPSKTGGGDAR